MSSPKYTPINRNSLKHTMNQELNASKPEKVGTSYEVIPTNQDKETTDEDKSKLRQNLMEKDKIIFEYSKMLKETEKNLDNSKKLLQLKDESINQLKEENKEIKLQIKSFENLFQKNEDEFHNFKHFAEEKILFLNKEKETAEKKLEEFTKLFESNQSDFQNTLVQYKKIEKQLSVIKQNFEEKEEQIRNYERIISEMRQENKQIPSLRKTIINLEDNMKELKSELMRESHKTKKVSTELQEYIEKFQAYKEENKVDKDLEKNLFRTSFELDAIKKELSEKIKEITTMSEENKNLSRENDKVIHYISNEILTLSNFLENVPVPSKMKQPNSIPLSSIKKSSLGQFSLKYELIEKNFDILRTKITDNYNSTVTCLSKYERSFSDLNKMNKELLCENEMRLKEVSVTKQKLAETHERLDNLGNEYNKLLASHNKLRDLHSKTKQELEEKSKKCENFGIETQLFVHNCIKQLKEKFPDLDNDCSNENILYYLNILTEDHTKLSEGKLKLMETIKGLEAKIQKMEEEKETLMKKFDRFSISKDDELRKAEELKTEELKIQRNILYDKIKSLTSLLEESNQMITIYEEENRVLKEKLEKLDHNHKMLTNSHFELEQSINNNTQSLQNLLEEKETKYNHLLREIELKDMQIISLEKLIERKEEELADTRQGRTYNSTFSPLWSNVNQTVEIDNVNPRQEGNNLNEHNHVDEFQQNDQAEEELNKLVSNYEPSLNTSLDNQGKVAGRIYSLKKNKN